MKIVQESLALTHNSRLDRICDIGDIQILHIIRAFACRWYRVKHKPCFYHGSRRRVEWQGALPAWGSINRLVVKELHRPSGPTWVRRRGRP